MSGSCMRNVLQLEHRTTDSCATLVEEIQRGPDPWNLAQRLAALPRLLFLDSAWKHSHLGRYSFIMADPFEWISSRGSRTVFSKAEVLENRSPFTVLAERIDSYHAESISGLPPFQGGVAGLFGYDLCHHVERLPRPAIDDFEAPDLAVGFYDWVIGFDHLEDRAWVFSTGVPEPDYEPDRRQRAHDRLDQ